MGAMPCCWARLDIGFLSLLRWLPKRVMKSSRMFVAIHQNLDTKFVNGNNLAGADAALALYPMTISRLAQFHSLAFSFRFLPQ